jgi:dipeptidyl aminopeptidase/acylaminoacyl peptidase
MRRRHLKPLVAACLLAGAVNLAASSSHAATPTLPGGRLYFQRGAFIYGANVDGSDVRQITTAGTTALLDSTPAVSPDGTQLAYTQHTHGGGVYVVPVSGGREVRRSNLDFVAQDPSWSPDGGRLAFGFDAVYGTATYFSIDTRSAQTGAALGSFGNVFEPQAEPSWSPDGRDIAVMYLSLSHANTGLEVINVAATQADPNHNEVVRPLAYTPGYDYYDPIYAPDGRALACIRAVGGTTTSGDLWLMNADGSGAHRLVSGARVQRPAWSPDGRWLAFAQDQSIYAVPATGGQPILLMANAAYPAWGGHAPGNVPSAPVQRQASTVLDSTFQGGQAGPWPVGDSGSTRLRVANGHYTVTVAPRGNVIVTPHHAITLADGTVTALVHARGDGATGLVARYGYTAKRSYACLIRPTARAFGCYKELHGAWTTLVMRAAPAILPDQDNQIALSLSGGMLSFSINGQVVAHASDVTPLPTGEWGMMTEAAQTTMAASYAHIGISRSTTS